MKKIKNPWSHHEGFDCFACAPHNPVGLHLDFYEDGDEIVSHWHPSKHYQGWVNTLHGGIISTLADEIAAWVVARKLQAAGVTTRLNVTFRRPLLTTDTEISLRAHLVSQRRNIATIHVSISNSQGELCAEAEIVYYVMSEEKSHEMGFDGCRLEDESKSATT